MKRILLVIIVLVLLLVAGIVVLPFFFKDDIVNYLKNETINGQISFNEDISIGLISTFPDLNIGIKDIVVTNNAPFEGDTLLSLKELKATVDLIQIISGNIEVKSIDLNTPFINVLVNAKEIANYDIALPSKEEHEEPVEDESDAFSFKLKSFTVSNGKVNYFDTSLATYATLKGLNFKMSGAFNEESMAIKTTTSAQTFTCDYDGIRYLKKVKLDYVADLVLYLKQEKYEFNQNELMLNDIGMSFDGSFQFVGDDMLFDLTYGLTKSDFKNLLSMIPTVYAADFAGLQASGSIGFDGHLKGLMTETDYPEFSLNVAIENGSFQYPDLPSNLNNTQLKMAVTNPGGSFDNTIVEISKCHFELDKEPFDMVLMLKNPDTDPYIAAKLLGKIDLGQVSKLIPLEGVTILKGIIDADLEAKGRMSAIETEKYEQFYAAGFININQFAYGDADLPGNIEIPNAQFEFSPAYALLKNMDLKLGESDLKFYGKIENYMPYLFHEQTIVGSLNLIGNYLDLNPWLTNENSSETATEEENEDTYQLEAIEIPANINFVFTALINKVKYDNYDIEKMRGEITIKDQILTFKDLGLNMLGGGMVVNGNYNSQNIKKPSTDFAFNMTNISISGLYKTFVTIRELLPIANQITGSLNGNMSISSTLGTGLMPILESINGNAILDIDRIELEGNKIWNKAVDYLAWDDGMKKLVLTKIKPNFKIINGDIFLDTFNFKIRNQDFDFGGKSSLNQTINYALDTKVPTKGTSKMAEGLISEVTKNKINVDLADEINLRFMIFGKMLDPDFKPVIMGLDGKSLNLKDQAKETAKELIDKGKKEALAKGKEELRKQAAKLKDEAQALRTQATKLKAEAAKLSKMGNDLKAEGDKLKKEADVQKAKIEKEMANLPKIARDKAMIPVNSLFDKATEKITEANRYFDLAKKPEQEADKLLKKADELEKGADDLLKE